MKSLKRTGWLFMSFTWLLFLTMSITYAQGTDGQGGGSIRGSVYQDVNGDGKCIDTGVEGEEPVEGIDIEFVSSDEETVVTLYTGSNGTYGLVAAGQSYWRVTAKPDPAKWIVTSENPLYAPVFPEDGLVQTGYDFCISQGTNAVIILPESGAPATQDGSIWLIVTAVIGFIIFAAGLVLERNRRQII